MAVLKTKNRTLSYSQAWAKINTGVKLSSNQIKATTNYEVNRAKQPLKSMVARYNTSYNSYAKTVGKFSLQERQIMEKIGEAARTETIKVTHTGLLTPPKVTITPFNPVPAQNVISFLRKAAKVSDSRFKLITNAYVQRGQLMNLGDEIKKIQSNVETAKGFEGILTRHLEFTQSQMAIERNAAAKIRKRDSQKPTPVRIVYLRG